MRETPYDGIGQAKAARYPSSRPLGQRHGPPKELPALRNGAYLLGLPAGEKKAEKKAERGIDIWKSARRLEAMVRIVNSYDQLKAASGDQIMIAYTARHSVISGRWHVCRYKDGQEIKTDTQAAWYDYGRKSFGIGEGRRAGLQQALAWVKATFGKEDFARNRSGDYVPREVNKQFPIPLRGITDDSR